MRKDIKKIIAENEALKEEINGLNESLQLGLQIRNCYSEEVDKLRNQVKELTEKNKALLKENIELLENIRKHLKGD